MSSNRPVVLVTGAAQGLGKATAIEFAVRGYDVAMVSLEEPALHSAAGEALAAGGPDAKVIALGGDLTDLAFAQHAVEETVRQLGQIDVLINNAAWREIITMRHITPESWDKTLRICLTVPAFMARWAARDMEQRGKGVVINISSVQAKDASGYGPAYIAAKGGLDSLTYELAALYGPVGVRVVSVQPGAIAAAGCSSYKDAQGKSMDEQSQAFINNAVMLQRSGAVEEIARAIAMIASDDASYITGTTITVDGGVHHHFGSYDLARQQFPKEFP